MLTQQEFYPLETAQYKMKEEFDYERTYSKIECIISMLVSIL